MRHNRNLYPDNWHEIAELVKFDAGYCCEKCGHPHDPQSGYVLTVHHVDCDPANNERGNLVALCQRCHMAIHGRAHARTVPGAVQMRLGIVDPLPWEVSHE